MVVIDENNVGTAEPNNSAAETAILQFLKDPYEFDLIDPKASAAIRFFRGEDGEHCGRCGRCGPPRLAKRRRGDHHRQRGEQGSQEHEPEPRRHGVGAGGRDRSAPSNCTTGSIIGTAQAHAAMVHISANTAGTQAITKASQKAIKDLLTEL